MPENNFIPPSDAVEVKTSKAFVPPSDALELKKKSSTELTSPPKGRSGISATVKTTTQKPSASSGGKSDGDIYSLPQNPGVLYQKRGNDWYKKVGTKFLPLTQGNVQERYEVLNNNAQKLSQFDLYRMEQTPVSIDPKTLYKEDPKDLKKQFENTYKNIKETEKLEQLKRQEQIKKSYPKEEEKLNWRLGAGKIYDFDSEDEVEEYKNQDPITKVAETILTNNFATKEELQAIDDKISVIVEASVKFAEDSPWPDDSELLKDVYIDQNYPFIVD